MDYLDSFGKKFELIMKKYDVQVMLQKTVGSRLIDKLKTKVLDIERIWLKKIIEFFEDQKVAHILIGEYPKQTGNYIYSNPVFTDILRRHQIIVADTLPFLMDFDFDKKSEEYRGYLRVASQFMRVIGSLKVDFITECMHGKENMKDVQYLILYKRHHDALVLEKANYIERGKYISTFESLAGIGNTIMDRINFYISLNSNMFAS